MTRRGAIALIVVAACGGSVTPSSSQPAPQIPARVSRDSASSTLIPPNLGTLHQEDIAITIQQTAVRITAIPLDESVIRTLAPDSYRALHATLENRRQQILQRASIRGIRDPRVWYVTYTGLLPDARFVPTDMTVTSGGREFRPVDVVPLSPGFSEQRVQPRETQRGLLIFEEALDVAQPIAVTVGSVRNTDWSTDRSDSILSRIDAERAQIRARATARP
jgi:hypothetical protein